MKRLIKQKDLADELRLSPKVLSKYLRGGNLSWMSARQVWTITGISVEKIQFSTRAERISALEEWCGSKINFGRGRV